MLQRGIGGGGGYSAGDPWADSGSTDDTASTTSLPGGIQDSGPADGNTGGFGDGTSRSGDNSGSGGNSGSGSGGPSIPWTGAEPDDSGGDDSTDTGGSNSTDSGGNDPTDTPDEPTNAGDVDDIQNEGDSTDGGNGGFGDGTSRSGDNSGSGGNSGSGAEDSRGSDPVSPDVPPEEVEAPGDHAPEPDNEPADNSNDDGAGLGAAGKAGVALLVLAAVMGGR